MEERFLKKLKRPYSEAISLLGIYLKELKISKEKKIILAVLCGLWDLSSPIKGQTRAPCSGSAVP